VLEKQQRELVDQSCTWISVVGVRWGDQDNIRQCRSKVRDTAVRLLEDNCLAVWLTNQSRLLSNRPDSRQTLAAATTLEEFSRLGEFTEITAESEQQDVPGRRALGRAMRRLVYTFPARTEGDQYHVAADVQIGSSAERLWMSLERIEDESRFVGTLVEDSLLLPDMSAGRRLLFEEYEVTGCRFRHHEQQVDATIALGK
jgi:hypothetical protein